MRREEIPRRDRLTAVERETLAECEATLDEHLRHCVAVVEALAKINEGKLWRETHRFFTNYLHERHRVAWNAVLNVADLAWHRPYAANLSEERGAT